MDFNSVNSNDYNKKIDKYNKNLQDNPILELDFIFEKLLERKEELPKLDVKTRFRKNSILNLEITKTMNKTKYTISIHDSYAIFTDSLKKLAIKYKVDVQKGDFPHLFANENTMFYIGDTPDISYYINIEQDEYNSLVTNT